VKEWEIPFSQLITIRAGELVFNPLVGDVQPIRRELVKITGVGKSWNCTYFNPDEKGCTIYEKRPKACRVLKCWDTEEIEELIEKDTVGRMDLIPEDDPVRPLVEEHEKVFPCPDMEKLKREGVKEKLQEFEEMVNNELYYRTRVVQHFNLSVGEELFYFGRPLFHLFNAIGITVVESGNQLKIKEQGGVLRTED
jgi:Fe-S-cluster containining protein